MNGPLLLIFLLYGDAAGYEKSHKGKLILLVINFDFPKLTMAEAHHQSGFNITLVEGEEKNL